MPTQEITDIEEKTLTILSPKGKKWKYKVLDEISEKQLDELKIRRAAGWAVLALAIFSGNEKTNLLHLENVEW